MSRHELSAHDGLAVVVGWDRPLNTFFGQVFDPRVDEESTEIVWAGGMPNEIHDPQRVIDLVRPFADIPGDLLNKLYSEAHA